jgi:hypothetical protein
MFERVRVKSMSDVRVQRCSMSVLLALATCVLSACGGSAEMADESPAGGDATVVAQAAPGATVNTSPIEVAEAAQAAPMPDTAAVANWSGVRALAGNLAAGCMPQPGNDFIDAASWNSRRLLPRDCRLLDERTPQFSWTEPADRNRAVAWTLTVRDATGQTVATRQSAQARLVLDLPLASGAYSWTVRYSARSGDLRTSAARRFAVAADARQAALPSGTALAQQVGQRARPRLASAGASWAGLGSAAQQGSYRQPYLTLIRTADAAITAPLPANPDAVSRSGFTSDTTFNTALMSLRNVSGKEGVQIEALAYAWRFTGEARYRDAGLTRLRNLAGWSPTGSTSETSQDQANRNIYVALATGADLLWPALSDADKLLIGQALRARLAPVVSKIGAPDAQPYDSHLQTAIGHASTALALAVGLPGFPEAGGWLTLAWDNYITQNFAWGEEDGGMGNGTAYSWYGFINIVRSFAELRVITGVDFTQRGFGRRLGDYLIAFTPTPNRVRGAFGDELETDYLYEAYTANTFRLYALMSRQPQHEWYWRQNPANLSPTEYISPLHLLVEAAAGAPVAPVAPNSTVWVFEDVGQSAFHSDATSTARSSLYFKSSRFGAYNHSHADQNSFVLQSRGAALLISAGDYPYYGSPHHLNVTRATRYKNALTFDGGIGQAESKPASSRPTAPVYSMDARGSLIGTVHNARIAVATGDATLAYRALDPASGSWAPLLSNAVRSVAYSKSEKVTVVYDWATSAAPRRWELNYHALQPFESAGGGVVRVVNKAAAACIRHHGPAGSFTQTDRFDVAPEKPGVAQHHGRFTVGTGSSELAMVTVIVEDCRAAPVKVTIVGTAAVVEVGADTLRFDRRSAELAD